MLTPLIFVSILTLISIGVNAHIDKPTINYLEKFGYVFPNSTQDDITKALRDFQTKFNLPGNGILNTATKNFMKRGRCGFPDRHPTPYVLADVKWPSNDLTYKFTDYTAQLSNVIQRTEVRKAFDEWAKYAPLTFTEQAGTVDMEIKFVKSEHGDGNAFDGPGIVLAHAFYPQHGGIHMDDDETWTVGSNAGTNLYTVLLHEIGHALGIKHSDIETATMYPYYRGYNPDEQLHSDDIAAIQDLYGVRQPDNVSCVFDYDAIMTMNDIKHAFNGTEMTTINNQGEATGLKTAISSTYTGIESVDEVTYNPSDDTVYIFKDDMIYGFENSVKSLDMNIQYNAKFAYVKDGYFEIYTNEGYHITLNATTMLVHNFSLYSQTPPLSDIDTATTMGSGKVHYYSNKQQHIMLNGVLNLDCTV